MVASVAVMSDIHGVLFALDRALADPAIQSAEVIVVTGDHIWGPQPEQVLDRLVSLGDRAVLVRGNADREVLQMSEGLDVGLDDDPVSVWGAQQLTASYRELLGAMPEQVTFDVDGFGPVRFCHATPRDDTEIVLVDSRSQRWLQVLADLPDDVQTVVCGHTHMPYLRLIEGRLVVNPGSVGLPYGRRGAHWAILANGNVTLGRTMIDPDELVRATTAASTMPDVENWVQEMIANPPGDLDALATFAARDGR